MTATPTTQPPPPARRWKLRFLIPMALLGITVVLLVVLIVRGTWADDAIRNPATPDDATICYVHRTPDGDKQVRTARVLPYSIDEVWAVLTDFDHYADNFPTLSATRAVPERDGRYHLTGHASAGLFGERPYEIHLRPEKTVDDAGRPKYVLSWDDATSDLKRNHGSWVLTPLDRNHTLAVYALEVEIAPYPTFLARNVLLSRNPTVMAALANALARRQSEKP